MRMKRFWSVCCLCFVSLFCLTGCDKLDAMRLKHARWVNEEKTEIEWQGRRYAGVPDVPDWEITGFGLLPGGDNIYTTAADVPVLLSRMEGIPMTSNAEATLIVSSLNGYDSIPSEKTVFILNERYDELCHALSEIRIDRLCWCRYSEADGAVRCILLPEDLQGIYEACGTPENIVSDPRKEIYEELPAGSFTLYLCDRTLTFGKSTGEIVAAGDDSASRRWYLCYGSYTDKAYDCYRIPSEFAPSLEAFFFAAP